MEVFTTSGIAVMMQCIKPINWIGPDAFSELITGLLSHDVTDPSKYSLCINFIIKLCFQLSVIQYTLNQSQP